MKNKWFLLTLVSVVLVPGFVFAAPTFDDSGSVLNEMVSSTGIRDTSVPTDLPSVIGFWANIAFTLVTIIFFILMVYAGYVWMLARGSEEEANKAKNIITMAIIGMIVLVSAYAITQFVTSSLLNKAQGSPGSSTEDLSGGEEGCCVDWVATSGQTVGGIGTLDGGSTAGYVATPACRKTTVADCRLQGETKTESDVVACPGPATGCWIFDTTYKNPEDCAKIYCK